MTRLRWLAAGTLAVALAGVHIAGTAVPKDALRTARQRAEANMQDKMARVDKAYKAAKPRCEGLKTDGARDACTRKAKNDRDAAVRQAKIEKVKELGEYRARLEEARKGELKPQPSADARYAAAKARCEMSGPDRDRCMVEAKQRFHRS